MADEEKKEELQEGADEAAKKDEAEGKSSEAVLEQWHSDW